MSADRCAGCGDEVDPLNSETMAIFNMGTDLAWCSKACLARWTRKEERVSCACGVPGAPRILHTQEGPCWYMETDFEDAEA